MHSEDEKDSLVFSRTFLTVLLVLSFLGNIILVVQLRYPGLLQQARLATVPAPVVTPTDHVRGNPDAKYTVIEYADFQCFYCAKFHESMRAMMKQADVRWVYRTFSLPSHPLAQKAALAAECAGEQGKFWDYADALYGYNAQFTDDVFLEIAGSLDMDIFFFSACLHTGKYNNAVAEQQASAVKLKVDGTPTFFLNGERFVGFLPAEELGKLMHAPAR